MSGWEASEGEHWALEHRRLLGGLGAHERAHVVVAHLIGKTNGWKAILNVLTAHYGARIPSISEQQAATAAHTRSDRPETRPRRRH
jgi:hypothetical protein